MSQGRYIYAYPFLLVLAWIGAWLVAQRVDAGTGYWIAMKFFVWLVPVFALIRLVEHKGLAEFLELRRLGRGMLWGVVVAAILLPADYLVAAAPAHRHLVAPEVTGAFVNAVLVAPITEEITFRGFLLRRLGMNGVSFWSANLLTSAAFLAMHVVGWHFQGRLGSIGGVARMLAPLLFLSLVFGWLKQRTASLYAPLALHVMNNLYQACLSG